MADTKITALSAITTVDPANDVLPIVDVSDTSMAASGTTKKITTNQILGASGTATLASATISGNLTVDTSTFAVDAANNRVFVGTAPVSTAYPLFVTRGGTAGSIAQFTDGTAQTLTIDSAAGGLIVGNANNGYVAFTANGLEQYRIAPLGVFTWADGAGGTRMTLNSTGLGVGVSPDFKLVVNGTQAVPDTTGSSTTNGSLRIGAPGTGLVIDSGVTAAAAVYGWIQARSRTDYSSNFNLVLQPNGGNVGIGVTPSAWNSGYKALELVSNAGAWSATTGISDLSLNAYFNASNQWIYKSTTTATLYRQQLGAHIWYNAPTGTAGTAITFAQAMTLDGSGNLLVGTTTNAGVRLDVQTTTGNCIGRVKSNAAASTASFIIDYVETLGCTYIKKAGSDVWIYGVQNDTSATPAFKINTASNVGVQLVSGATAWTTLSDETVKDIIEPISNAVAKVGSIRSVIGKFKTDDSSKRRSFLIAQDVQSVLPEAVDVVGENNELGLRYTEVIPLLVAAIKELTAEVNALKNA